MKPTNRDITHRTMHHSPTPEAAEAHGEVRKATATYLRKLVKLVPDSRELSVAVTNVEQAMMWANAGIARNHDHLGD